MKIAVSSAEKSLDGKVDPRFGRAAYFIIYDPENDRSECLENTQSLNAPGGAGIQAAQITCKCCFGRRHGITRAEPLQPERH